MDLAAALRLSLARTDVAAGLPVSSVVEDLSRLAPVYHWTTGDLAAIESELAEIAAGKPLAATDRRHPLAARVSAAIVEQFGGRQRWARAITATDCAQVLPVMVDGFLAMRETREGCHEVVVTSDAIVPVTDLSPEAVDAIDWWCA